MAELEQTNVEIQRLREHLHVVCAWTKRIKVDGEWMSLEAFLHQHLHIRLTHGISEDALKEFGLDLPKKD